MTLKNTHQVTLKLNNKQVSNAKQRLIDEFTTLLTADITEPLKWKYSMTDLMEITHIVFLSDMLVEDDGSNCTFLSLVRSACNRFGLHMPSNPSSYVNRAQNRKNIRSRSFFDLYCWQLYEQKINYPLCLSLHLSPTLCTTRLPVTDE